MSVQSPRPCWVCKVTPNTYRVDLYEDGDCVHIKRFFTDETLPEELKVKLGMIYASSKALPNIGQRVVGGDCRIIISDDPREFFPLGGDCRIIISDDLLEFLMNADHDT